MASVEPFEQRVSIEAQSWPSSFARQPDDTELRLVGIDEVAIDGEQPSDLGHGEELAGRILEELDDAVRDGLDVLMLQVITSIAAAAPAAVESSSRQMRSHA